VIKNEKEK